MRTNRIALAAALLGAPVAASASGFKAEPYGFLRAEWLGATSAVDSFGRNNFSAYTAAANPVTAADPSRGRDSFEVDQTRIGLRLTDEASRIEARLETDFVDFGKASPTTTAVPRLRRAVIEYGAAEGLTLRFGQDWSIFSPSNPFTANPVGNYFQAGNVGFMRIQAAAIRKAGRLEHAIALSLPAANAAATDSTIEIGGVPAIEAREQVAIGDELTLGVSGIAAALRQPVSGRFFAGAADAFAAWKGAGGAELRAAAYWGKSVASLGLLGLGAGDGVAYSPTEAGGYVSARAPVDGGLSVFGGLGGAAITESSQVKVPGLAANVTARAGLEYKPVASLAFYGELAWLHSRYGLAPADAGRFDPMRTAFVLDAGTQLNF